MSLTVLCPHCGKKLVAQERIAGREVTCPGCHGRIKMPGTPIAVAKPPPPPAVAVVEQDQDFFSDLATASLGSSKSQTQSLTRRPSAKKSGRPKWLRPAIIVGAIVAGLISGIAEWQRWGSDGDLGTELAFNGGQLFYKSPVTENEATSLGHYLVQNGVFNGEKKTVQILKSGNIYEFHVPIKNGFQNNQQYIQVFRVFARELSESVFNGTQVNICMCDDHLNTLRTLVP